MFQSIPNHSKPMNAFDPSKLSASDRKTYDEGMAIARKKLHAARQADTIRKVEAARANEVALAQRMGASLAARCFGVSTAAPSAPSKPTPAPKPSTSKSFSAGYSVKRFSVTFA